MDSKQHGRFAATGKLSGADKENLASKQDVEFSLEEADEDDLEALARAEEADRRVRRKEGQGP